MAHAHQEGPALGEVDLHLFNEGTHSRLYQKLGLEVEIPGMGLRMRRCSILIDRGVVKQVNVEEPGKFEVSDAGTMLKQLG